MDYQVKWFPFLVASVLLIIPSVYSISMSIERKSQIFNLCYNRQRTPGQISPIINGQNSPPLASSVENLIALIEKIENSTTTRSIQAKDLAATLLRKFRSDGNVVRAYSYLDQGETYEFVDKIEDILLESPAEVSLDDQTILTENERCSLYFMLSYHINQTEKADARTNRYSTGAYRAPVSSNSRSATGTPRYGGPSYAPVALTVKPREYGVGSYRSNNDQAIALNRLLLGVIAGQLNSPGVSVRDIITKINPNIPQGELKANVDEILNPLMAVTLANIHSMAAFEGGEANTIAVSGSWESTNTLCTTEYTLSMEKPSDATLANIRGGIDGYYIGELTKSLTKTATGSRLRLSQILRYYYDNIGGRVSGTGYCDRATISIDDRGFRDAATNYLKALELSKNYIIGESIITSKIEKVRPAIDSAYAKAKSIPAEDSEWCSSGGMSGYKADCETPTDLFVVIDLQSADADKYKNLTGRLINKLNLGIYGSSASILSMNREDNLGAEGQTFRNNLKHLAWASYNRGCTGCAMSYIREDTLGSVINAPSTDLYLRMNDTLRDFEANKWFQLGAPAKPFIIMGGSYTSRNIDQNIRMARYTLKSNHRDVPVFLITNANENDLTEYISSPQDIIRDQDGLDVMTQELSQKICQVPATFQYPDCRRVSSEATSGFEAFITPGRLQYWAMYPEYFLKSYDIVMKFFSSEGDLKVCFGRYPKPEETGRCWEAKKNEEIRIDVSDPCKDRDVLTCEPFYFTITPPDQGMSSNTICSDKKCLNARQIKFKFSHSGIACSSAVTLVSSLFLAIICSLLASFLNPIKRQF
ncbi:uncharacterized protein LOC128398050 [Panonychus citri]|uniref:uncharacterized protein LOC128398050 n=1 Tax=Panonychus citri TaxID=50023 RepID=UPI00230762F0|nr:uncharacterized protein LOC128398050 [Panonychus citri]